MPPKDGVLQSVPAPRLPVDVASVVLQAINQAINRNVISVRIIDRRHSGARLMAQVIPALDWSKALDWTKNDCVSVLTSTSIVHLNQFMLHKFIIYINNM